MGMSWKYSLAMTCGLAAAFAAGRLTTPSVDPPLEARGDAPLAHRAAPGSTPTAELDERTLSKVRREVLEAVREGMKELPAPAAEPRTDARDVAPSGGKAEAMDEAQESVSVALERGVWTVADQQELDERLANLTREQRDVLLSQVHSAINRQELRLEMPGDAPR